MTTHYKEQCLDCARIVGQCRCPSQDKPTRFVVCALCQRRRDEIAQCAGEKGRR